MMRAVLSIAVGAPLIACGSAAGDPCTISTDCEPGLICSLEGVCATYEAVSASFDSTATVDVITPDTAPPRETVADAGGCRAVEGVFEASEPPCGEAAEVRTVTGIALAEEGHGLAGLASVANQVIENSFEAGEITLALHVDGELRDGCAASLAWIRTPEDRDADCTAVFSTSMPFDIPNLVSTSVDDAVLDPNTNRLTGIVDKAALIESMEPALRDVAERLIVLDVDTDGDQVPDKASAILDIGF